MSKTKKIWKKGNNTKLSNSENIGKNLKPFNLEAAKSGKPVCTRDGRKAKIICFDRNAAEYHIVALIECKGFPNKEEEIKVYNNAGKYFANKESSHDLMMLSEKKEGWVNIYKDPVGKVVSTQIVFSSEETAKQNINSNRIYISTVKIEWYE